MALTTTHAALGEVMDNNGAGLNVSAGSLAIDANRGIGSGDALETAVDTLAAFNEFVGNIRVANDTPLLTIGLAGPLVGVANVDDDDTAPFGVVEISNTSSLTVDEPVLSEGDIILSSLDTAAIDTDLPVPPERTHMMLGSRANWAEPCLGPTDKTFDAYPSESIAAWHERLGMER